MPNDTSRPTVSAASPASSDALEPATAPSPEQEAGGAEPRPCAVAPSPAAPPADGGPASGHSDDETSGTPPVLTLTVPDVQAPPGPARWGLFITDGDHDRLETYETLPELVERLRELYGVDPARVFPFFGVPLGYTRAPGRCLRVGQYWIPLFRSSLEADEQWSLADPGVVCDSPGLSLPEEQWEEEDEEGAEEASERDLDFRRDPNES